MKNVNKNDAEIEQGNAIMDHWKAKEKFIFFCMSARLNLKMYLPIIGSQYDSFWCN